MPRLSKIGAAALAAFGWTSGSSVTATYLVVAGGGAGGGEAGDHGGGGGGAGGYRTGTASLNPTLSYTVTVGAGGAGTTGTGPSGSGSTFSVTTSAGGGGGGANGSSSPTAGVGVAGASGGGGAADNSVANAGTPGGAGNTPSTSPVQGYAGGQGLTDNASYSAAGGGGGSSAVGAGGVNGQSGAGGAGTANTITGSSVTYAGGGGGGRTDQAAAGAGGSGGGGTGGTLAGNGNPGTANLGGGGGGGGRGTTTGGNGGSGVVIISYVGAQQFGGGVVTSDGTNTIHTFTTSGTLSVLVPLTASALVVAGGGGGGGWGGGGAGGFRTGSAIIDTASNYVVTVGAGGSGSGSAAGQGASGTNSVFSSLTSTGGGGGGGDTTGNGLSGGSGGGAGYGGGSSTIGSGNTPSTSPSQGNNGGDNNASQNNGGGGGGAGAVGSDGGSGVGGNGGNGSASSISGASVTYAGGGGGGVAGSPGTRSTGGTGGGGAGGINASTQAVAGTANTGGGGGGMPSSTWGASGGSGVVIIAYPGSTQQMAGGTVTISGGNVIHTFTSSGYLTPIKYASRSLRFRSSATAYLNRTSGTPTSGSIFTHSFWVKRGALGAGSTLIAGQRPTNFDRIYIQSNDTLLYQWNDGTSNLANVETTQVFRDPSAWYHIVVATDTTQATASNRVKIYVNGVQVTALTSTTYPSQNSTSYFNTNAVTLNIGRSTNGTFYLDGYLTEVNFIDGAALTPSSFGAFNSYGVWQPTTYGGSYGTNGFYLTFGNNTSTTTLGYDTSPQGNNWTTNNISVTAGVTYDSMLDVPTLTSATVANYATGNPVYADSSGAATYTNGNLTWNCPNVGSGKATISATTGKFYWEAIYLTNAFMTGVADAASVGRYNNSILYQSDGTKGINGTFTSYGATYTTSDVIGVALDLDGGTVTFYKNNSSQGSISLSLASITNATAIVVGGGGSANTGNWNFGQRPFTYTPPSGFVALNTYNLSTPTIPNGATQFAASLYTGTNATLAVTNTVNGTAMQPDWLWVKRRDAVGNSLVWDVVRGVTKAFNTSTNGAEQTATGGTGLASFNSNGFTLGGDFSGTGSSNTSAATYVAWQWKANGASVTNTAGSVNSTISANTTSGFSVATYTAPSGTFTFGHGLGVTPNFVILRPVSIADNWNVWITGFTAKQSLYLQSTSAVAASGSDWFAVTSSTVQITTGQFTTTGAYVAYVFAAVAGYSAFGSYTGNGSTDGPFVYTGFRPRFILIKCSSNSTSSTVWTIFDTSRSPYNASVNELYPNLSAAEGVDSSGIDILSNGFKPKRNSEYANLSGWTYIYYAVAENPFKYSSAR